MKRRNIKKYKGDIILISWFADNVTDTLLELEEEMVSDEKFQEIINDTLVKTFITYDVMNPDPEGLFKLGRRFDSPGK